jgi:hypothetical protein
MPSSSPAMPVSSEPRQPISPSTDTPQAWAIHRLTRDAHVVVVVGRGLAVLASEPSIITELKPSWIERWHTSGLSAVVLVHHDRDMREFLDGGLDQVAQEGAPAYLRAPAEACTITGLSVSSAASMMARICSRLLTLKAGTP